MHLIVHKNPFSISVLAAFANFSRRFAAGGGVLAQHGCNEKSASAIKRRGTRCCLILMLLIRCALRVNGVKSIVIWRFVEDSVQEAFSIPFRTWTLFMYCCWKSLMAVVSITYCDGHIARIAFNVCVLGSDSQMMYMIRYRSDDVRDHCNLILCF